LTPEHRTQVHNDFVAGVCKFLVSVSPPGSRFDIKETCLMGERAATVETRDDLIRYDILLIHVYKDVGTHYYCECKTRNECSSTVTNDLKRHLRIFLHKAYKTIDSAKSRYGDNYGFLFISDMPFEMADSNITFRYLKETLSDIPSLDEDKLNSMTARVRIFILSDWFIGLYGGV